MGERPRHWDTGARDEAYAELKHPADLFVEIWGEDLSALFGNALFALYDQMVELEGLGAERTETIEVCGPDSEETLRSLLSEALYIFAAEGFVANAARLDVRTASEGPLQVTAHLWGETLDRRRHTLLAEVKAVTYHQLTVGRTAEGGWRATVLFDV